MVRAALQRGWDSRKLGRAREEKPRVNTGFMRVWTRADGVEATSSQVFSTCRGGSTCWRPRVQGAPPSVPGTPRPIQTKRAAGPAPVRYRRSTVPTGIGSKKRLAPSGARRSTLRSSADQETRRRTGVRLRMRGAGARSSAWRGLVGSTGRGSRGVGGGGGSSDRGGLPWLSTVHAYTPSAIGITPKRRTRSPNIAVVVVVCGRRR